MFLYVFMSWAFISFPHLLLRYLNGVHRSFAIGHVLIYPIFIHRILLFLGLVDFLASEPIHVIGPLERCVFLYVFMSCASISFPHLFLHSLNEVHRSFAVGHVLIYPIFIHRILLFLGLVDFLASEPIHVVGPLGATFLRQRAALSVSQGASFSSVLPPPSSIGAAETSGGAVAATDVPPPTTLDDSDIRRTLDHVLIVQAAQGQILVDILDEIRGLRADLARF